MCSEAVPLLLGLRLESVLFVEEMDKSVNEPELKPEGSESSPVRPKAAAQQFKMPRAIELSIPRSRPVPHHPEPIPGIHNVEVLEHCSDRHAEAVDKGKSLWYQRGS